MGIVEERVEASNSTTDKALQARCLITLHYVLWHDKVKVDAVDAIEESVVNTQEL